MKLINIGFGNIISANRLVAIVSPESAPIKRVMREAYYKAQKEYNVKTGQLVVIAARGAATKAKTDEVFKDLTEAFRKTGMIIE